MSRSGRGRLSATLQSEILLEPLSDASTITSLKALADIFHSCFGPSGSLKQISNSNGGHVTVTSRSARLLQCVHVTRPLNRLLFTVLQGHVANYMDYGIFAARLALNLIDGALQLECHKNLVIEVISLLLEHCLDVMNSSEFNAKFAFSDDSAERTYQMLTLVKSIVSTKPLCGLSGDDQTHISKLVLEAYLATFSLPVDRTNRLHYICLEGFKPSESRLVDGILFETPHIPVYAVSAVNNVTRVTCGEKASQVRVLLVCSSMAGDFEDSGNVEYQVDTRSSLEDSVVEKLLAISQRLLEHDVSIVVQCACSHCTFYYPCDIHLSNNVTLLPYTACCRGSIHACLLRILF